MSAEVADLPAMARAFAVAELPGIEWVHGDDRCDCVFQRIGMHKNPYLAMQEEIRLCCIWAKLGEQYPDLYRMVPGWFSENERQWILEPREWDGEDDMPRALWYRQLVRQTGRTLPEIREAYADLPAPEGTPALVELGSDEVHPLEAAFAMIDHLAERLATLDAEVTLLKGGGKTWPE